MSSTSGAERERQFVDSNLLVYSFDSTAGEKREKAMAFLAELWNRREGCVSLQVLQEFFVSVTTKLRNPLTPKEGAEQVSRFAEWDVHEPGRGDLVAAIDLQQRLRVSFWDAMIIQSARQMRCGILWTEDLSDRQYYAGVQVRNPFVDSVME